jgi:glycosyltransferase A (GT-A) superfamily protein (DUF2064 family)
VVQEGEEITVGAILVFARRPDFGLVKTRLAARIGKQSALCLYRAFLADTLDAASQSGATTVLAHTPGPHFPEQDTAGVSFEQRGNSFAERFDAALEDAANRLPTGTPLIIVGADAPHISPKFLRNAFDPLKEYGAVIGPNVNGGFYLLGFSSRPIKVSEVFSYASIEEITKLVRLLQRSRVRSTFLDSQFDVDTPQDLAKLIMVIDGLEKSGANWIPKNTRDALHDLGIITMMTQTLDR